jgi:hydroxylamine reductase
LQAPGFAGGADQFCVLKEPYPLRSYVDLIENRQRWVRFKPAVTYTTGVVGYPGATHIPERPAGGRKDFSALVTQDKTCPPPKEIETGTITGGFAHHQVLALADKVVDAVKSGATNRFVVMAGCDGRQKSRGYYTEVAENLPKDTVILTAGCAKYRYKKLNLGDIGGIPRVLDASNATILTPWP